MTLICDALGRALATASDAPLFGLAGSGNLEIIAAFGGTYHAACHEAGAVAMADGWAQITGEVGLASIHQGPGLTNAVTALVDSAKARTPLLVLTAEAAGGAQVIDQAGMLAALGISVVRVAEELPVGAQVVAALERAAAEHRPVVLVASVELQLRDAVEEDGTALARSATPPAAPVTADDSALRRATTPPDAPVTADGFARPRAVAPPDAPDPGAVAALAARLGRARRPAILAGRGAAGAGPQLRVLAERIGAILATTAPAHGLFADDPYAVGIAGGFASPLATRLLGEADLVLVVGATLSSWTTCHGKLFPNAAVERIDLDPATEPTVLGDAAATASALLEHVEPAEGWRTGELERSRPSLPPRDGLDPAALCVALDELLDGDRCLVLDSGHFMAWPALLWKGARPGGFLFGQAFQAVGLGLARAIGAAVARPDRVTVAMVGDGGALMGLAELDTAARLRLPLLVVIYNDAAYGAEVHDFRPIGVPVDAAQFPDRDLAGAARALGCSAITLRSLEELEEVRAWAVHPVGPLVVDAKVDPTADAVNLMTPLGAADWSTAPRPNRGAT